MNRCRSTNSLEDWGTIAFGITDSGDGFEMTKWVVRCWKDEGHDGIHESLDGRSKWSRGRDLAERDPERLIL